jgi:hypothetical protein
MQARPRSAIVVLSSEILDVACPVFSLLWASVTGEVIMKQLSFHSQAFRFPIRMEERPGGDGAVEARGRFGAGAHKKIQPTVRREDREAVDPVESYSFLDQDRKSDLFSKLRACFGRADRAEGDRYPA